MIWKTKQIETALSVKLLPNAGYGKVQFNSQNIEEGDLFIALPGKRDGHDFVVDALERAASAAIVSQDIPNITKERLIKVENTLDALLLLSEYKRRISKAKIIAVTGSVGKTSTKEAIKIMLGAYGNVHASHGTFNNSLGVQLTLASMPDNTEYAVIEMGMNAKGELSALSNQVIPDIAVITTISEGHLEFFDSVKEIADAKCEIFEGLDINEGVAIINRDIDVYSRCVKNIDAARLKNVQTFGTHQSSGVRFVSHELLDDQSTRLLYDVEDESIEIIINNIIPIHLAENFAAAFAVVHALDLDLEPAATTISAFEALLGRGRLISLKQGTKSYRIICDYYNSNPQSLQASLEHFAQFSDENKIAVLGDMAELGAEQLSLHKRMVPYIANSGMSKLFLIGSVMPQIQEDLPGNIMVQCYPDVNALIKEIDKYIQGDELILIKGSRGMQLDKVAQHLGVKDVL